MHPKRLENRTHGAARDYACACRGRTQNNPTRSMAAVDVMMQSTPLAQRDTDQRTFRRFRRLAYGLRHLSRLAMPESNPAFLITDDDQRRKTKPATTLHHFRDAIDVDQSIHEFAVALFPITAATAAAFTFTRHCSFPSLARQPT